MRVVAGHKRGAVIVVGLIAGYVSGLLGIGAAFLLIPSFVHIVGLDRHKAHATALATMVFTSSTAVILNVFARHKLPAHHVEFIITGAVLGALVGARIMPKLSKEWLATVFSIFLLLGGVDVAVVRVMHPLSLFARLSSETGIVIGFLAGVASGSLGVGSGGIVIPLAITFMETTQLAAEAISLTVVAIVSFVGGIAHMRGHRVDVRVALWAIFGGIPGAVVGLEMADRISAVVLESTLAATLLTIGGWQLYSALVKNGEKIPNTTPTSQKGGE